MIVDSGSDGRITGRFRFFPIPENPSVPEGEYEYQIRFDAGSGVIDMAPARWIKRPRGFRMVAISATLFDTDEIRGKLLDRNCKDITLARVAARSAVAAALPVAEPVRGSSPGPSGGGNTGDHFAGDWSGSFECRWGFTNAQLKLTGNVSGGYIGTLSYRNDPKLTRGTAPGGGTLRFRGKVSADGNRVDFANPERVRINSPRWDVDSFRIERTGDDRTIIGGVTDNGSCTSMKMTRDGTQADRGSTDLASGNWYGSMSCKRGRSTGVTAEVELQIRRRRDSYFELSMVSNFPNSMTNGTVETLYLGEPSSGGEGAITFVVHKKVRGGVGQPEPGNFEFDVAGGKATMSGGQCQTMAVAKVDAGSPRLVSTAPEPPGGGSFFGTRDPRERCETVIRWTDRLNAEYPGRDFYRSRKPGDDWRKIKLFADDDFVPVFGKPFDRMSYDQRRGIAQTVNKECYRNPFTKPRMDTFRSAADRVLDDNPDRQLTSDGYSSTVFAIREVRRLRNEIQRLSTASERLKQQAVPFAQKARELLSIKETIDGKADKLWPSEKAAATAAINTTLSALAVVEALKNIEEVEGAASPQQGLDLAATALVGSQFSFHSHLPAAEKSRHSAAIEASRDRFAASLAGPLIEQAAAAPADLQGVRAITRLLNVELPKVGNMGPKATAKYATALEAEKNKRLRDLINDRFSQLDTFPSGLGGLIAGEAWHRSVETDFSELKSDPIVKDAMAAFAKDRAKRLRASVGEFETALRNVGVGNEAAKRDLLNNFLAMTADKRDPISLEYHFALEAAR